MNVQIFDFSSCQDLSLSEIGRQQCTPLYSFGPFIRNEYIFHYVINGKGYYTDLDNSSSDPNEPKNTYEINAGEGFLIQPHTKHIYHADQNDPWQYIWIVFRGLSVPQYLLACGIDGQNSIYRPKDYSGQTIQRIKNHLLAMLNEESPSKPFIMGHFHLFFSELESNSSSSNTIKADKETSLTVFYISQALRFIGHDFCEIESLDEISNACGISRSHLSRLFREHLHMSLQEYFIQFRLQKAAELLLSTSQPVCEIAYQVGYQNELNLLRSFKKRYAMSPNAYRKKNKLKK